MSDDCEIKIKIRTGTSTQPSNPRFSGTNNQSINNFFSPIPLQPINFQNRNSNLQPRIRQPRIRQSGNLQSGNLQSRNEQPITFEFFYYTPRNESHREEVNSYFSRDLYSQNLYQEILERSARDSELRRNPVVQLDLKKHTCRSFEVDNECSICSNKYCLGETLTTLDSCNHTFHFSCIDEWGKYKSECPLCRKEIPILER
jgi:hypothetical protein